MSSSSSSSHSIRDYSLVRSISSSGSVHLGVRDGLDYAIKILAKSALNGSRQRQSSVMAEKRALFACRHTGIAKVHHTFTDADNLYFVFDYYPHNLGKWIKQKETERNKDKLTNNNNDSNQPITIAAFQPLWSEREVVSLLAQLYSSLEYLHSEILVAHRRIEPENLCFDKEKRLKILDLSQCAELKEDKEANKAKSVAVAGALSFAPPEVLTQRCCSDWIAHWQRGDASSQSCCRALQTSDLIYSDAWACGVLAFLLLTGVHPFDPSGVSASDSESVRTNILERRVCGVSHSRQFQSSFSSPSASSAALLHYTGLASYSSHFSPEMLDFLSLSFHPQPSNRPIDIASIRSHPLFVKHSINWQTLWDDRPPFSLRFRSQGAAKLTIIKKDKDKDKEPTTPTPAHPPLPPIPPAAAAAAASSSASSTRHSLSDFPLSSRLSTRRLRSSCLSNSRSSLALLQRVLILERQTLAIAHKSLESDLAALQAIRQAADSASCAAPLSSLLQCNSGLRRESSRLCSALVDSAPSSSSSGFGYSPLAADNFRLFVPSEFSSLCSSLGLSAIRFRVLKLNKLNRNTSRMFTFDLRSRAILGAKPETESERQEAPQSIPYNAFSVRDLYVNESNFLFVRPSAKQSNLLELGFLKGEGAEAARASPVPGGRQSNSMISPGSASLLSASPGSSSASSSRSPLVHATGSFSHSFSPSPSSPAAAHLAALTSSGPSSSAAEKVWRLQFSNSSDYERFYRLAYTMFYSRFSAMRADAGEDYCPPLFQPQPPSRLRPFPLPMFASEFHDQWMAAKRSEGWTYGAKDSVTEKTNSSLMEYEQLSSEKKRLYTTLLERSISAILSLGFTIEHLEVNGLGDRDEVSLRTGFSGLVCPELFLFQFAICDFLFCAQQSEHGQPQQARALWSGDPKIREKLFQQFHRILAILGRAGFRVRNTDDSQ